MEKRYQVFVSSTFLDLKEERAEVMQALLELDCIPAGMELFPAANEDQWTLIKKVIDDCDYYIVIVGGRYGSLGPSGLSFTEMEYRYAVECGKPVIGFLHHNPEDIVLSRTEATPEARARLAEFRELVQRKLCKTWRSPADLGSKVSRSLYQLMKTTPAIGWVRANLHYNEDVNPEMLRLRNEIETLRRLTAGVDDLRNRNIQLTEMLTKTRTIIQRERESAATKANECLSVTDEFEAYRNRVQLELTECKSSVESCAAEIQALRTRNLRLASEFDSYRKGVEREWVRQHLQVDD